MKRDFSIESIPDTAESETIIEDNKLNTDYIPEDFPHREEVIDFLWDNVFSKLLKNKPAENAILLGRSGTGKTAITKAILNDIRQDNPDKVLEHFETAFINCSRKGSYKRVLQGLSEELGIEWKEGVANDVNTDRFFRDLNTREKRFLFILDEIDFLKKSNGKDYINDVIYDLTRPHEVCPDDEWNSDITLLMISNDTQFTDYLSDDNRSEADPELKECKRYFVDEIKDILQERHDSAFKEDILNEEALVRIAKEVRETYDSDIRKGIKILRKVSEADHEDKTPVEIAEAAMKVYRDKYIEEVLQGSTIHQLVVIKSLCANLSTDKRKLEYVNQGYRRGCERLGLQKNQNSRQQHKSKSFVYRTLDKLVDQEVVSKQKDHSQPQNPFIYKLKVDLERLYEKTNDKLRRRGYSDLQGLEESEIYRSGQEKIEQEAAEKLQEVGVKS